MAVVGVLKDLTKLTFDKPVIKKQDVYQVEYYNELTNIYEQYQTALETVVSDAKQQAEQEGYGKGLEQGREEVAERFKQFTQQVQQQVQAYSEALVAIIKGALEKIVAELPADEVIHKIVLEVVNDSGLTKDISVKISNKVPKKQVDIIRNRFRSLLLNVNVILDPSLTDQELFIETHDDYFYFSINHFLDFIVDSVTSS